MKYSSFYRNLIKISLFISLSFCFCRLWRDKKHEQQKQMESEMKVLILIRLFLHKKYYWNLAHKKDLNGYSLVAQYNSTLG